MADEAKELTVAEAAAVIKTYCQGGRIHELHGRMIVDLIEKLTGENARLTRCNKCGSKDHGYCKSCEWNKNESVFPKERRGIVVRLVIYGKTVPQGRARFKHIKCKDGRELDIAYDPTKSRDFKALVYEEALKVKPIKPFEGEVGISVVVFRAMPKDFSKKKQQMAINGEISPITRPDWKNYFAGIEDALKGVMWKDDSQVVDVSGGKRYSDIPRVEIEVWEKKMLL